MSLFIIGEVELNIRSDERAPRLRLGCVREDILDGVKALSSW